MPFSNDFVYEVIDRLRTKLLDLTGRNTLISFRHRERSRKQLRIIDTSVDSIYMRLEDDKPLSVEALPLPKNDPKDEQTIKFTEELESARETDEDYKSRIDELGQETPVKTLMKLENELRDRVRKALGMRPISREKILSKQEHAIQLEINPSFELSNNITEKENKSRYLQTLLYPDEMERKLSSIYGQAKLSESETGINTLFCAFGFLEWYESENSNEPIYSPILLYPVQIEKEIHKGEYMFKITSRDEELHENTCLQERLKEFDLQIFNLDEEENPQSYLDRIDKLVQNRTAWKVHRQATLGFFTFSNLVMYHDLSRDNLGDLSETSLLTNLIAGPEKRDVTFNEEYEVDRPEIQDKIKALIADADSSQASTLVDVAKGRNVVIEGPPGTGKSQTITNIIASAMANGQSVLFIAVKRAALEVVKKRLDHANLGKFCLELHSNKVRKTDVLKSLKERLNHRKSRVSRNRVDALASERETIMKTTWKYVKTMNKQFYSIDIKLRSLIWRFLCLLKRYPNFSNFLHDTYLEAPEDLTERKLENGKMLLNGLEKLYKSNLADYDKLSKHPWHGIVHHTHTSEDIKNLIALLSKTLDTLSKYKLLIKKQEHLGTELMNTSINKSRQLYFSVLKAAPLLEKSIADEVIPALILPSNYQKIRLALNDHEEIGKVTKLLEDFFNNKEIPNDISTGDISRISHECSQYGLIHNTLGEIPALVKETSEKKIFWAELNSFLSSVANILGINEQLTYRNSLLLLHFLSVLCKTPNQTLQYRTPGTLDPENSNTLETASKLAIEIRKKRTSLSRLFTLDNSSSVIEIEKAARTLSKNSIWGFILPDHRAAKKLLKGLSISKNNISTKIIAAHLFELADYYKELESFSTDNNMNNIVKVFFKSIDTPFDQIIQINRWGRDIVNALPSFNDFSLRLRSILFNAPMEKLSEVRSWTDHPDFKKFMLALSQLQDSYTKDIESESKNIDNHLDYLVNLAKSINEMNLKNTITFSDISHISKLFDMRHEYERKLISNKSLTELFDKPYSDIKENFSLIKSTLDYIDTIKSLTLPPAYLQKILRKDGREYFIQIVKELKQIGENLTDVESVLSKLMYFMNGNNDKREINGDSLLDLQISDLICTI